jgi:hypothetical protein
MRLLRMSHMSTWLGVELMASEPSSLTLSHAHPLPKRPAAAALNLDFASSMLPNAESANAVHQPGCSM